MVGMRDVIIVGAGPAGIASATYLKRAGLDPLLFEFAEPGGLLRNANLVENYPGFSEGISGEELAARFTRHLERLDVDTRRERVKRLSALEGGFRAETDAGAYSAKVVIVATGTVPIPPAIRGAQELRGERVFSEVISVPSAKEEGASAIVVGGGDAAFDYALTLHERGYKVMILTRSSTHCLPLLLERTRKIGIVLKVGVTVESVKKAHAGLSLTCKYQGKKISLTTDILLAAFGRSPNLDFLEPAHLRLVEDSRNPPATSLRGLFVAGDVIRGDNRQAGIAVGDGILAAMLAERLIRGRRA